MHPHELHTHLYGCLNTDDLRWLASRKPPRWHIFQESYNKVYGRNPDLDGIFKDEVRLRKYCIHSSPGNFGQFQCAFDFVISVSHIDPDELYHVAQRVAQRQTEPYAEYRMLLPPFTGKNEFIEKTNALSEGMLAVRKDNTAQLAMSLWRGEDKASQQYDWLREAQKFDAIKDTVTGVDFCAAEEGHPPGYKAQLFAKIRSDNAKNPGSALAILYHVGESFTDKTIESAARWVYESARNGAHRLGHAVALFADARESLGQARREFSGERAAHIRFLLSDLPDGSARHIDVLNDNGYSQSPEELETELSRLSSSQEDLIHIEMNQEEVKNTQILQEHLARLISELNQNRPGGICIESCPTSNLMIAGIKSHPLSRMLESGIPVVIGADDPGVLDTTLEREFEIIAEWPGIDESSIERMIADSHRFHARDMASAEG